MKVVDAIAGALDAEGTEVVLSLPDSTTIHVLQAAAERGLRILRGRHEHNVVAMADGYARATGHPAVCAIGNGPGVAQAGTAIMTAARGRSPVLVMIGQNPTPRGSAKSFDAQRFAHAADAGYVQLRGASHVAEDMHEAFRLVRLGRGPVITSVPHADDLEAEIRGGWQYEPTSRLVLRHPAFDPASTAIDDVAGLLASVRKPVILAGRGAVAARDDVAALADRIGALISTSLQARELFRDHPRNLGIFGTFGSDACARALAEADCVLAVGIGLNAYQTGGGAVGANAKVIQIDHDPARIGEFVRVDEAIIGDAGAAVRALHTALANAGVSATSAWSADHARRDTRVDALDGDDGRLPMRAFLRGLDQVLGEDRVVILESGHHVEAVMDEITVPDPGSWVWTLDFTSIGVGFGIGLGTAVAKPDRLCVLFVGDGGFAMSLQELETAARERIPLVIVVLDDCAYGSEIHAMNRWGKPADLALFDEVDFAAVARAFGVTSVTVRSLEDLSAVADRLDDRSGPLLVDAKVRGLQPLRPRATIVSRAPVVV